MPLTESSIQRGIESQKKNQVTTLPLYGNIVIDFNFPISTLLLSISTHTNIDCAMHVVCWEAISIPDMPPPFRMNHLF